MTADGAGPPAASIRFEVAELEAASPALRRWRRLLTVAARRHDVDALLGQIAHFLGAPPGHVASFRVALHALPEGDPFSATLDADLVTLRLPGAARHAERVLGIVAHEICHAFEAFEDDAVATPASLTSAERIYGRLALHEGLATAIGNGWLVARLTGRLPPGPWYENGPIATLAEALHPLVAAALARGQVADAAFFGQALQVHRATLGERMWEAETLFGHIAILADDRLEGACDGITPRLASRFERLADVEQFDGIDAATIDRLLAARATRVVVVACGASSAALALLRARLVWMQALDVEADAPFVAFQVGGPEPACFVFGVTALDGLDAALAWVLAHPDPRGVRAATLGAPTQRG